jgi:hypothetical protein
MGEDKILKLGSGGSDRGRRDQRGREWQGEREEGEERRENDEEIAGEPAGEGGHKVWRMKVMCVACQKRQELSSRLQPFTMG